MKKFIILFSIFIYSAAFSQEGSPCDARGWSTFVLNTAPGTNFSVPIQDGDGWIYTWDVIPNSNFTFSGQGTPTITIIGNGNCIPGIIFISVRKVGVSQCTSMHYIKSKCTKIPIEGPGGPGGPGNGTSPIVQLPTETCFGFDPIPGAIYDEFGLVNYGYLGNPYSPQISPIGLTFTWYFRFLNGVIFTSNDQNPIFSETCENPVKSFACIVSNGVQTKLYKSNTIQYPIPGLPSGPETTTCFIHDACSGNFRNSLSTGHNNSKKIIISPNPTNSMLNFVGENLATYKVSLYNSEGIQIIKDSNIENKISLENFKKGLYIYILSDENGNKQEGKIIKN